MNTSAATTSQLSSSEWQERRASHHARVIEWTQPMRDRRARGESHPVLDFLHTRGGGAFLASGLEPVLVFDVFGDACLRGVVYPQYHGD